MATAMQRPRTAAFALLLVLLVARAEARTDKHFGVLLDTSGSMMDGMTVTPDCAASFSALAAVILRELLDPGDRLDIVTMSPELLQSVSTAQIRQIAFQDGTVFGPPLSTVCQQLATESAHHQVIVVLTDGQTGEDVGQARAGCPLLLGGAHVRGFGVGAADLGFLSRLLGAGNVRHVSDPARLVEAFAEVFGKPMGARAVTGSVRPGEDHALPIRPYVASAYLAMAAGPARQDFRVTLLSPQGAPGRAQKSHGDNGHGRFYEVLKLRHPDPGKWTLSVTGAPVYYVLIQRYDLDLVPVDPNPDCVVGRPTAFRFHLVNGAGAHFHDPAFYREDGFRSFLQPPSGEQPASPDAQGYYEVVVTPDREGSLQVSARVENDMMLLSATASCVAKKPPFEAVVSLTPPAERLYPGEVADLGVQLRTEAGEVFADPRILDDSSFESVVEVNGKPAGKLQRQADGSYRLPFRSDEPGQYKVTARFSYRGQSLEASQVIEVSGLGRHATLEAPDVCWLGETCPVKARLFEVMGGSVQDDPRVLQSPGFRASLQAGGGPALSLGPLAGEPGAFGLTWQPTVPGETPLVAEFAAFGGKTTASRTVLVSTPLRLVTSSEIDFGTLRAGEDGDASCGVIDFTGTTGYEGVAITLRPPSSPPGVGGLVVRDLDSDVPCTEDLEIYLVPQQMTLPVCVRSAACGEGGSAEFVVSLVPKHPKFADQVREVTVRYRIEERSFLACNWWWIVGVATGLFVLFVIYGFVRPSSFSPELSIKLAGKEKALARSSARILRSLPGGRSGFYRSAAVWFTASGSAVRARRSALLGFEARPQGEVRIVAASGVELTMRVSAGRKFVPVEGEKHVSLVRNRDYRVGDLYFRVSG